MCSYIYEAIEHGNNRPVKVFVASIDHSKFHWHYDYELILVLKGEVLINTSPGQTLLREGDIFLLNSKMVHELQRMEQPNICLFIQLNQNLFLDTKNVSGSYFFYLNSAQKGKEPKNGFEHYKALASRIGLEYQKATPNMYRVNSYIYTLLADFFDYLIYDIRQTSSVMNPLEDIELLMQVINYIQERFKEEDVLDTLYRSFGMGEKTLYRFLKKYIGLSPKALLMENRIQAAKEMLHFSNKTIPYIAGECGFKAENTFYRVFKKEVGVTPNEYRQKDVSEKSDSEIKGYLQFKMGEAVCLLKKIVKEKNDYEV
ncbi:AraC family transcriptional regulator [uncultured Trichococcus sp.]|uniref:AraC family transcriptional regulator n=1 Tax=uncultured Trichococcus sp. TaxID=189665 RepID=UPI002A1897F1|nr:AraC family transcriptional regulator [uncultured Trichococcus sp.]